MTWLKFSKCVTSLLSDEFESNQFRASNSARLIWPWFLSQCPSEFIICPERWQHTRLSWRGRSRINQVYGALCNRSLWRRRATVPREKCGGWPAMHSQGTGKSGKRNRSELLTARGRAHLWKRSGYNGEFDYTRPSEESERATWCKNARNCGFSHYNPVTRRSYKRLLVRAREEISR